MFKFAKESLKVLTCIAAGAAGQHIMSKRKASKNNKIVYKNYTSESYKSYKIYNNDNITEHNFLQGRLGNCNMIASMATLAGNRELYDKVVPGGQKFQITPQPNTGDPPEFVFNLYKFGKLHKVVVDEFLPTDENRLIYSKSSNGNLVGPLLEKALVKLHFNGNYEAAVGINGNDVFTSFTNNFFEHYFSYSKDKHYINYSKSKLDDLIRHGLKTKSQMLVSFIREVPEYNLLFSHGYTLIDMKDNLVNLYNPHGNNLSIPKKIFFDNILQLQISYFKNEVFGIPEIKTSLEFTETWSALKNNEEVLINHYNLIVEEDDTELLINFIVKHDPAIFIRCCIFSESELQNERNKFSLNPNSFRANLNKGKYKVLVILSESDKIESTKLCLKYLEHGGRKFIFRLAASKQCSVEKQVE